VSFHTSFEIPQQKYNKIHIISLYTKDGTGFGFLTRDPTRPGFWVFWDNTWTASW